MEFPEAKLKRMKGSLTLKADMLMGYLHLRSVTSVYSMTPRAQLLALEVTSLMAQREPYLEGPQLANLEQLLSLGMIQISYSTCTTSPKSGLGSV